MIVQGARGQIHATLVTLDTAFMVGFSVSSKYLNSKCPSEFCKLLSVHTHLRALSCAGGAICVQIGAEKLSKMCMRLRVRVFLGTDESKNKGTLHH